MSALIVVIAVARAAAPLLFKSSTSYCFVDCGACGYVGKGEHFLAFRARSGSGGSAAGRQRRSSTYPQTEALYGVLDRALSSGEFGQRSA